MDKVSVDKVVEMVLKDITRVQATEGEISLLDLHIRRSDHEGSK